MAQDNQPFCAEHMALANGRTMKTLNDIGSRVDWSTQGFHIAEGILRRATKPGDARRTYKYCPSVEGLLPAWLESVDHLIRWLTACFEVHEHPDRNSNFPKWPVEILRNAFPEFVDIDNSTYFHAFWATYDSIRAYGFEKSLPWERNVPDLLHQLGAMQQFMPYHKMVNPTTFQPGERFEWNSGAQSHTYAKDLFDFDPDNNADIPICPALRLKETLDGTCTPSFEGLTELKPKVSTSFMKICPKAFL